LKNFEDNSYNEIKELIFELIQSDANSVQGYTSSNMQRCFAIKPNISELLDIIRQAYCELIDNMIRMY
jgi:DNA mismatch repair protein MSH4